MERFAKALRNRLNHKEAILKAGGEQALSHSTEDLVRIEKALNRLRSGSFGFCLSCGEEIPKERLEIYPEAERCTPCQTSYEKGIH